MKKHSLCLALVIALSTAAQAIAGPNDFFGSGTPPGGQGVTDSAGSGGSAGIGGITPSGSTGGAGADYSDDEKRMQKKLRANIQHAKSLINRADSMLKTGKAKNDDKLVKKGKILKEIGEKSLAELQANMPIPSKAPTESRERASNPNNL